MRDLLSLSVLDWGRGSGWGRIGGVTEVSVCERRVRRDGRKGNMVRFGSIGFSGELCEEWFDC